MITVAQLIEELKKFPQDIPVAAWGSSEGVDFITSEALIFCPINTTFFLSKPFDEINNRYGDTYEGPFLLIDEFDVTNQRKE